MFAHLDKGGTGDKGCSGQRERHVRSDRGLNATAGV